MKSSCCGKSHALPTWLMALLLCLTPVSAYAVVLDRVAAIVNGEAISLLELQKAEAQMQSAGATVTREVVLNGLIEKTLVQQRARSARIRIEPARVEEAVTDIMRNNGIGSMADLQRALAEDGSNLTELRREITDRLMQVQLVQQQVQSQVRLTEEALKEYYDTHIDEFAAAGKIHLWQMMGAKNGRPDAELALLLTRLRTQVTDKASFDLAAEELADTPDVSVDDIGWIAREDLSPELADMLAGTGPGQTTGLIEQPDAWLIFLVEDATASEIPDFVLVRDQVEQMAGDAAAQNFLRTWVDSLKQSAYIEVKPLNAP